MINYLSTRESVKCKEKKCEEKKRFQFLQNNCT